MNADRCVGNRLIFEGQVEAREGHIGTPTTQAGKGEGVRLGRLGGWWCELGKLSTLGRGPIAQRTRGFAGDLRDEPVEGRSLPSGKCYWNFFPRRRSCTDDGGHYDSTKLTGPTDQEGDAKNPSEIILFQLSVCVGSIEIAVMW